VAATRSGVDASGLDRRGDRNRTAIAPIRRVSVRLAVSARDSRDRAPVYLGGQSRSRPAPLIPRRSVMPAGSVGLAGAAGQRLRRRYRRHSDIRSSGRCWCCRGPRALFLLRRSRPGARGVCETRRSGPRGRARSDSPRSTAGVPRRWHRCRVHSSAATYSSHDHHARMRSVYRTQPLSRVPHRPCHQVRMSGSQQLIPRRRGAPRSNRAFRDLLNHRYHPDVVNKLTF
jgi:hypothetical protein